MGSNNSWFPGEWHETKAAKEIVNFAGIRCTKDIPYYIGINFSSQDYGKIETIWRIDGFDLGSVLSSDLSVIKEASRDRARPDDVRSYIALASDESIFLIQERKPPKKGGEWKVTHILGLDWNGDISIINQSPEQVWSTVTMEGMRSLEDHVKVFLMQPEVAKETGRITRNVSIEKRVEQSKIRSL